MIEEGKIFGNLKVNKMSRNEGNGKIFYDCTVIDTGRPVEIRSDRLIKITDDHPYKEKVDIIDIGKAYGNIKVLELDHNDHGKKYFNCTCEECIEPEKCTYILRSDHIKDSSRKNKYRCKIEKPREIEDLTGRVFGDLIVVSLDKLVKGLGSFWICKCKCGESISVYRSNLMSGNTTRCRKCADKIVAMKNTKEYRNSISDTSDEQVICPIKFL